jgi:hypothetical protein
MKENFKIILMVHGVEAVIDYDKEEVSFDESVSKELVKSTNNYLLQEGFLDKEFVRMQKLIGF